MKRTIFALLAALAVIAMPLAYAGNYHHDNDGPDVSVSIDDDAVDGNVTDCSQIKVRFDGEPGVRAEETLPVASLSRLSVSAKRHSGVRVSGWNESGWSIKACKAAASSSALSAIRVNLAGTQLTSSASGQDSFVFFLIRAPKNATLDVDATNGPVSLFEANGTFKLRAENGPIAVKGSSGTIDAATVNGPIAFSDGSGTVKLTAQNGPISVKLDGTSWDGSLDASTQNGPLSLKLPRNYRSGVVAEARGHGPVSCKADACSGARRTWDDEENRRIEIGSGPAVIHVTTNNGPLSIKER